MNRNLTDREVQQLTGLHRDTLLEARRDGRLGHYKIGSRVLYSPEHVAAFLALYERPARLARHTRRGEHALISAPQ